MSGSTSGVPSGVYFHDGPAGRIPVDASTVLLALSLSLGRCLSFPAMTACVYGAGDSPLLESPDLLTELTSMLVSPARRAISEGSARRLC